MMTKSQDMVAPFSSHFCHQTDITSIKNTKELVDKLRGLEIPPAQKLVSYDVTALMDISWMEMK